MLGDEQALRDLVGAEMVVEQEQHLELAGREGLGNLVGYAGPAPAVRPHLLEQPTSDASGKCRLSLRDAAQELDDSRRRLALQEVARSAGADRSEEVLLHRRGRQHDHLAFGCGFAQQRQRREAVDARHGEVEQDQVWLELVRASHGFAAVLGLADDIEPMLHQQPREG